MHGPQGLHLAYTLACLSALVASAVAIGAALGGALDLCGRPDRFVWVESAVVAAGAASAAAAVAVICILALHPALACNYVRLRRAHMARALLSTAGLAAHAFMLCAVTVFWRYCITRAYIQSYGGRSPRGHIVQRRINYFEYWESWSLLEQSLYWAGCAGGTAAWLAALLLACMDARSVLLQEFNIQVSPLAHPLLPRTTAFAQAAHASPWHLTTGLEGEQQHWAEESSGSSGSSPRSPKRRLQPWRSPQAASDLDEEDANDDADSCCGARHAAAVRWAHLALALD